MAHIKRDWHKRAKRAVIWGCIPPLTASAVVSVFAATHELMTLPGAIAGGILASVVCLTRSVRAYRRADGEAHGHWWGVGPPVSVDLGGAAGFWVCVDLLEAAAPDMDRALQLGSALLVGAVVWAGLHKLALGGHVIKKRGKK